MKTAHDFCISQVANCAKVTTPAIQQGLKMVFEAFALFAKLGLGAKLTNPMLHCKMSRNTNRNSDNTTYQHIRQIVYIEV